MTFRLAARVSTHQCQGVFPVFIVCGHSPARFCVRYHITHFYYILYYYFCKINLSPFFRKSYLGARAVFILICTNLRTLLGFFIPKCLLIILTLLFFLGLLNKKIYLSTIFVIYAFDTVQTINNVRKYVSAISESPVT